MKKQLPLKFVRFLSLKMPFRTAVCAFLFFLTLQSSFAQKWNIIAQENDISSVASCYTSIAVVGDVPYVAYIEATYSAGATGPGKVKMKNPTTGLWEQVGSNLSALAGFTKLYKDKNGDLYVTYIDRNSSYKLAVKKLVAGAWVPLSTGNDFVSTNQGTGTFGASDIRGDLAFDKDNILYVSYTERPAGNASGYAYVRRFVNNAWETVGGAAVSSDLFTAGNGIAFDSSNVPYVVYIQQTASNSGSGVIKAYRFVSNSWEDVSPANPVAPGTATTGATNAARHTSIAIDDTDSPVITYFNTTSAAPKGTSIRLSDKVAKSWTWLGDISTRDTNRNMLINDSAGNLYTVFQDALIGSGTSATVRVFKKASGTSTFTEVQNIPITSESGVGIDAQGPNSTTAATKSIVNAAIALGSNTSKPYIVYAKTNGSGVVTPIVRLFDPATTWNGSTWSNGTPTATAEAVIEGTYTTTANGGGFTAKKLTVNSGSLTVNTSTNVTVQNEVINNAGGNGIVVENNANLIQVNNTTNTGNVVVKRNSNALSRLDYTMWSSPVASQNLAAFSPLTSQSPSRFYTYDAVNNVYGAVPTPASTNFSAGTGYLIRMPNTAVAYPATETFAAVFTGVPNNGTVSLTSLTSDKFYAVGNPYPSVVSADLFLNGNSTGGTLYFWRKTNGIANTGSAYATYTLAGGAGTAAPGNAANDILPNGKIQVGQGFIVKTGVAATSLQFTNAMRETAPTSTQFLKIKNTDEKSRIWLNLTSGDVFSQALVAYMDGATEGVDNGIDGKYINDSKIALTSDINGEEYTIQGRPAFDAADIVPLNFKTDKAGEYKIAIDHTDGLFAKGQNVYLVDSVTGTETNLTKEAYTFTAESGATNSRFSLKYESTSKVGSPVFNENTVTVYKNNGTLYVNSAASAIVNIKVFNIQGRLIAELKGVNATTAAIKNLKATQQVLLIQVTSEDKKVVTKKVVN